RSSFDRYCQDSNAVAISVIQLRNSSDMVTFQQNDAFCLSIKKILDLPSQHSFSTKEQHVRNHYAFYNGILHRLPSQSLQSRLVIPRALYTIICEYFHDDPAVG